MTDKRKPISASNPPESKGIRIQTGYQPTEKGVANEPPSGSTNVQAPLSEKSLDRPKKTSKKIK